MRLFCILSFCCLLLTGCKTVAANLATEFVIQNALSPVTEAVWQGGNRACYRSYFTFLRN